ncbi:cupin domain-containing protein [Paeniglutamicibacter sp. MACA_103]|uniref:cupin domain-containing protein n=1 Tax=Paeniglutamicibacter sp. MACA_103 TaxID=3377337 RepID=UPI003894BF8C
MIRRVVVATNEAGKSVIVSDGTPPVHREYIHTPGFADALVWRTDATPHASIESAQHPLADYVPGVGETIALAITFPPGSVYADAEFDPLAARAEDLATKPGLAECFEEENPGMHTTPTIDYAVVTDGQLVLELDDGEQVSLQQGDVLVQNGARHAWRNHSDKPATLFVVLMGAVVQPAQPTLTQARQASSI